MGRQKYDIFRRANIEDNERIVTLVHDLEWYDSADTGEDDYRKTVSAFKAKWFKGDRCERLKGYIDEEIKAAENRLIKMLNESKD